MANPYVQLEVNFELFKSKFEKLNWENDSALIVKVIEKTEELNTLLLDLIKIVDDESL